MKYTDCMITENKKLLVTITLVLCYVTGLMWITQVPEAVMAIGSKVRMVSYAMFLILAVHTVLHSLYDERQHQKDRGLLQNLLSYCLQHIYLTTFAVVSVLIVLVSRHTQPLIFLFMILAMADKGFDAYIKPLVITHTLYMVVTVLLSMTGLLEQIVILRGDGTVRYSMGYIYPLELQGHYLFIVFMYIYFRKNKLKLIESAVLLALGAVLFRLTDARTDFYVLILVIVSAAIVNLIGAEKVMSRLHQWFWSLCALTAICIMPICAHFYTKSSTFWKTLDRKLTWRVSIANRVLDETGYSLFGRQVEWIGIGGRDHGRLLEGQIYNWIDCSFIKDAVDYGWIFVVLLAIAILLILAYYFRKKDIFGVIVIEGLLLSATIEYHSFMPSVYPLLLMMSSWVLLSNREMLGMLVNKDKE